MGRMGKNGPMTSSTPHPSSTGAHAEDDTRSLEEAGGTAPVESARQPEDAGPAPRLNPHAHGNWRSLVLSMAAVAAVVAVLYSVVPRPDAVSQPPVDVTPVARAVHDETGATVWVPQLGEPGQPWKATSVRHQTAPTLTWYAGYQRTDDDSVFVAVQQAGAETPADTRTAWVEEAVAHGKPDGTTTVDGRSWARYTTNGDPARRGLVGEVGGMTTVVSGLADYETLEHVAASLRPYRG